MFHRTFLSPYFSLHLNHIWETEKMPLLSLFITKYTVNLQGNSQVIVMYLALQNIDPKILNKYEIKLRGLIPNSYIHVYM
jgi:hypothetical protein